MSKWWFLTENNLLSVGFICCSFIFCN